MKIETLRCQGINEDAETFWESERERFEQHVRECLDLLESGRSTHAEFLEDMSTISVSLLESLRNISISTKAMHTV